MARTRCTHPTVTSRPPPFHSCTRRAHQRSPSPTATVMVTEIGSDEWSRKIDSKCISDIQQLLPQYKITMFGMSTTRLGAIRLHSVPTLPVAPISRPSDFNATTLMGLPRCACSAESSARHLEFWALCKLHGLCCPNDHITFTIQIKASPSRQRRVSVTRWCNGACSQLAVRYCLQHHSPMGNDRWEKAPAP